MIAKISSAISGRILIFEIENGVVTSRYGKSRIAVFPIGIDPEKFAQQAAKAISHPDVSRLRRSLNGEKLAIGVDRLDYSKGLVNRISAFDRMWTLQPALQRTVSLLQIATPSRGGDRSLWQSAERARKAGQRRQWPSWRSRLDSDPLSQQGFQPDRAGGSLSHRAGRRGDTAA